MDPQQIHYIPTGSIAVSRAETDLDAEHWELAEHRKWSRFAWLDNIHTGVEHQTTGSAPCLDPSVQESLLQAPKLSPYARLFRARWAKLEFGRSSVDQKLGIIRVYLLPDDVQRRSVDRSDPSLRKTRNTILRQLDYSTETWKGHQLPVETGCPVHYDAETAQDHEDISLLQLFNTIPSPNPNPSSVSEPYTQDAMYNLSESKVPGLGTNLYPYQGRSAALMLQKEIRQEQVLDPRLLHLKDAHGSSWYMDPVAGTVLLEPRYYDTVSGGILAEEMGAGKTIICLALILATRHLPTNPPERYKVGDPPVRDRAASLADMAASCATRNAVPWRPYFEAYKLQHGYEFGRCTEALLRNPGYFFLPGPEPRRRGRYKNRHQDNQGPEKVYLSSATVVIVPNNLVAQWKQEIQKHTKGLDAIVLVSGDIIPPIEDLLTYDIILFSQSRFERLARQWELCESRLLSVHFKRCIVDEGHKLGNSKISNKSMLLLALDSMHFSSRWIVTGTPSRGLFGVDSSNLNGTLSNGNGIEPPSKTGNGLDECSPDMERKDLERIGAIAALYMKARPWANTTTEAGDTLADWRTYLLLPKHNPKSQGRWDCLKATLNSLIIRHRLAEVGDLLPPVDEKVVILEGSYQDQLSLNLFSMMIVFNSVQSQRTDRDYFFHQKQRKALQQIVHNLKQASFFGGSFFTAAEIGKSVETAEKFLRDREVPISPEDEALLEEAIRFGHLAMKNKLRNLGNRFHEMAVWVTGLPGNAGQSWSMDGETRGDAFCTLTSMLLGLQKLVYKAAWQPEGLNSLLNGGLIQEGMLEREKLLATESPDQESSSKAEKSETLAGNTKLGKDSPRKARSHGVNDVVPNKSLNADSFSGLELTKVTSTVSAKLTYLVDCLVRFQEEEKIIVFYENENVAWYLASMLDVLQIQHLIYAKGLTTERRAQYVNTFHHNPKFRVLLMDISQAAFGLDMREASRIYFINPVLNPQVEAQAIGRVRRISQKKPVSVETLVLKNSIDEVILERKRHMTQAEHRQVKSILDVRPIYNWIKNAKVSPMCESSDDISQMADLRTAQPVFGRGFGRGFGRTMHPDDGLILGEHHVSSNNNRRMLKRSHGAGPGGEETAAGQNGVPNRREFASRPARRVRFAADSDED